MRGVKLLKKKEKESKTRNLILLAKAIVISPKNNQLAFKLFVTVFLVFSKINGIQTYPKHFSTLVNLVSYDP